MRSRRSYNGKVFPTGRIYIYGRRTGIRPVAAFVRGGWNLHERSFWRLFALRHGAVPPACNTGVQVASQGDNPEGTGL